MKRKEKENKISLTELMSCDMKVPTSKNSKNYQYKLILIFS